MMPSTTRREIFVGPQKPLFLVLAVALLLRLSLTFLAAPHPDRFIRHDAIGYDQLARNLVSGHGFSRSSAPPYAPDNLRTPVYPGTVALFYLVFGHRPHLILYFQTLLSLLTVFLIYRTGKLLFGHEIGIRAAFLFAISTVSVLYSALLWSDTLFTFFLVAAALASVMMLSSRATNWVVLGGLLIGVATLTHSRSLFLPILIGLILFVRRRYYQQFSMRRSVLVTLLYLGSFILVLSPWVARNQLVFGVPNLASTFGTNLLTYSVALTESAQTGEAQLPIAERYLEKAHQQSGRALNSAELDRAALHLGVQKITQAPLLFAKVYGLGVLRNLLPSTSSLHVLLTGRTVELEGSKVSLVELFSRENMQGLLSFSPPVLCLVALNSLYLFTLCLLILRSIRENYHSPWTWFLVALIGYLVLLTGLVGAPRFRLAAMPFLCLLAAPSLAMWKPARHLDETKAGPG